MKFAIEQKSLSGESLLASSFSTAEEAWAAIPALVAQAERVRSDPAESAHRRRVASEVIGFTVLAVVNQFPEE